MFERVPEVIKCVLNQSGIFMAGKDRFPVFSQTPVYMHSIVVLHGNWFWHETERQVMSFGRIFDHVIVNHERIRHPEQGVETEMVLGVPRAGHFVRMIFPDHTTFCMVRTISEQKFYIESGGRYG